MKNCIYSYLCTPYLNLCYPFEKKLFLLKYEKWKNKFDENVIFLIYFNTKKEDNAKSFMQKQQEKK